MPDRRSLLAAVGIGLVAAVSGAIFSWRAVHERDGMAILHGARVTDVLGKPRDLLEWQGRVLVINFWATWCEPCREEIPAFVRVRQKLHEKGVEIVGIAIDQATKVAQFVESVKVDYPILLAGAEGLDLMRRLGNPSGGLPFTVVFDPTGRIAFRNLGALTGEKLEANLLPMLRK